MLETKRAYWRHLDNAATLFSAASNKKDTRVFRFYCELHEEIKEKELQEALNITVKKYPVFLSVMRTGIFWHYLEKSKLRPKVQEEYRDPCSNIYVKDKRTLLFEVTYYKNRINFEVYHALTDGTGATEFLRELIKNYLLIAYKEDGIEDELLADEHLTVEDQEEDGFARYYTPNKKQKRNKKVRAFQVRKPRKERGKVQVTESTVSVQEVLQKSRELGVSVTVFMTTVFICAIHKVMTKRQEKKPVVMMIPVNLRKFFPSSSMLNFFGWIEPGYQFTDEDVPFEDILNHVKLQFEQKLTKEKMGKLMASLLSLELHPILRLVPLSLKNFGISTGAKISAKDVTAILSNMNAVRMPSQYEPYIKRFGVFTSTPKIELCMCSFGDVLSLGFTSRFDSTNIKRNFLKILKDQGIKVNLVKPVYPEEREEEYPGKKVFQFTSFFCLVAIVSCISIGIIQQPRIPWHWFASGGMASMWIALAVAFYKRYNLMKNALWQLAVVTAGCLIWDVVVGWRGWSVDFVLPIVCVMIQCSMAIIAKTQKYTAREYMSYLVTAGVYGCILPLILVLTGAAGITYPSILCIGISFLFLAALTIFRSKELKEEMHKKLHL